MTTYKQAIAARLITPEHTGVSEKEQRLIDKISAAVDYAWNNWDADIIATYYEGEKPKYANAEFIENWVANEDFDADGYDVDYLKKLFQFAD